MAAAPIAGPGGLSPSDALATLLTVEGLLFAAFSVSISLADPAPRARAHNWGRPIAWWTVAAISAVAVGGAFAWRDLYIEPGFPHAFSSVVIALVIAIAIPAQAVIAGALVVGSKYYKPGDQ